MKKLLVLTFSFLFLLCGCTKEEKCENPYRLKTYTSETTIAGSPQSSIRCDYFYDKSGQLYQWDAYWKGELRNRHFPEYDEYGNVIRNTIINSDSSQTVEEHSLTLDEQHRILEDVVYVDDSCQQISKYAYDKNGNQTMHQYIRDPESEESSITCRIDTIYDEDGNPLREDIQWNQKLPTHTDYSYTGGKLDRKSNYDERNRLTDYTQYIYNETGLTVTLTTYAADGNLVETVVNTYDEFGNLLSSESRNETMDRNTKIIYTYELIESADNA